MEIVLEDSLEGLQEHAEWCVDQIYDADKRCKRILLKGHLDKVNELIREQESNIER